MHILKSCQAVSAAFLCALAAFGQATPPNRIIGAVTEVQQSGVSVKTDAGEVFAVAYQPQAQFKRVAPGEKDLSKAQPIAASDIAAGDRVLARGVLDQGQKTLSANLVIVMSRKDLEVKEERERAEWLKRGTSGLVVSTDPAAHEIRIRIPSLFGQQRLIALALADNTRLRRYAPGSIRFADAKPCTLADIKPGDQLRALGNKNEDGTRVTAEEVVTGNFQTMAGTITMVGPAEMQLKALDSGKVVTVALTQDSSVRRMPAFGGMGGGMGPAAGNTPGGGSPGAGGPGGGPAAGGPGGGGPGRPGGWQPGAGGPPNGLAGGPGGMGRGMPDIQQMLEHLPQINAADLKPGETVVISTARDATADRLTAVSVLANADFLIAMAQRSAARAQGSSGMQGGAPMGSWNLGDLSMIPMP